jgi:hypothetical protein
MRTRTTALLGFASLCLAVSSVMAFATVKATRAADPKAAVVVDEETGVIRFMVAGVEAVRIDAAGLHVNGDITYAGTMTDTNGSYTGQKP